MCATFLLEVDTVDEFSLRRTTTRDLDLILRHREAMFRAMGLPVDGSAKDASRNFFAGALARNRYHGWFVETGGAVVAGGGVVLLEYQPGPHQPGILRPFVVNMWTEEAFRRRGMARRLMMAMIEWARAEGYSSLNLHASDAGRALYEELGFRATNEMRLAL